MLEDVAGLLENLEDRVTVDVGGVIELAAPVVKHLHELGFARVGMLPELEVGYTGRLRHGVKSGWPGEVAVTM